jgi:hypothetical protein
MSVAVIEQAEVKIGGWERIEFHVQLPDLEQIIITANQGGYYYDTTTSSWQTKQDLKKFRLTGFDYELDEGTIKLKTIRGNFFTKANRVGAREAWLRLFDQATLDQIPDTLHDYARNYFAKEISTMLQKVIDTGLVVKASA